MMDTSFSGKKELIPKLFMRGKLILHNAPNQEINSTTDFLDQLYMIY